MRFAIATLVATMALGATHAAHAFVVAAPSLTVTVDNATVGLQAGLLGQFAKQVFFGTSEGPASFELGEDFGSVGGNGNTDPFIAFAIATTDNGAPSHFVFNFSTPIVTLGGPQEVSAELELTLTDGGSNGVTISPPAGMSIMTNRVASCDAGVDLGPATLSASQSLGSAAFQPAAAGIPSAACNNSISISLEFDGSGGGDQYVLVGRFEIRQADVQPVPEPMTLGLLGVGLLGLAGARRLTRQA